MSIPCSVSNKKAGKYPDKKTGSKYNVSHREHGSDGGGYKQDVKENETLKWCKGITGSGEAMSVRITTPIIVDALKKNTKKLREFPESSTRYR